MAVGRPSGFVARVKATLEMIRFSHSVFALPFALLALVLSRRAWPPLSTLGWVLLAMVAARSAAMAFNRIADRNFDAKNPRTSSRHLVTGALSVSYAWTLTLACAGLFVLAAAMLNPTALALSPVVLVVLLGYSLLKRVTVAAHVGVGLALGLSPLGAWIAGAGGLEGDLRVPLWLGLAVVLWVAGFDLIYACQDVESDRRESLHSMPARFGVATALRIAAVCHLLAVLVFVLVGIDARLGLAWYAAVGVAGALLAYEHAIVSEANLARVNMAFFNVNGIVACVLGGAGILGALAG